MKACAGCKYAEWKKTKAGKLHPSGSGACKFDYKIPPLPGSRYFVGTPIICGGSINRKENLKDHCIYYRAPASQNKM